MNIAEGNKEVYVNDISNWPLIEDIFVKLGYSEKVIDYAKKYPHMTLKVKNIDLLLPELSAWGIPWKRIKWNGIS